MGKTLLAVLIFNMSAVAPASVSTNVPLSHWSYDAIERLTDYGWTDSDLLSTRPVTRLNMARLIREARAKVSRFETYSPSIIGTLDRLEEEYAQEIEQLAWEYGTHQSTHYVKPLEDPYVRHVNTEKMPNLENEQGRLFQANSNSFVGFAMRGQPTNNTAFYLHPELQIPSVGNNGYSVIEGYGKLALGPIELELGKDSLWWGPGYHGGLIMSTNAKPFTMFKASLADPILLPGFLRRLGPVKSVFFLTELERNRVQPYTKLSGLRVTMKPKPDIEVGFSRTIMFGGGTGNSSLDLWDYLQIFWPKNIQGRENQLAGFDVSWRVPMPEQVPARSVKLYGEFIGEDAAGIHQYRPLLGAKINDVFKTGRTDIRFEYAKTFIGRFPNVFYTHGTFGSGYTYNGRVMGHHIGTGGRDLFVRLTHWLTPEMRLGFDFDRQTDMRFSPRPQTDQLGVDVLYFGPKNMQFQGRYRYEFGKNQITGLNGNNHIVEMGVILRY